MGTTSTFFGGGGGGAVYLPHYTFTASNSSWSPPFDGEAYIHVIGGGGNASISTYGHGGSAGGYCRKLVTLSTGTSWNFTIGTNSDLASGNGAACSATDGSSTLTANGGQGGTASYSSSSVGGTASGGDVNYQGGRGGRTTYTGNTSRAGGGAVNIGNNVTKGGDCYPQNGPTFSGGGGVGGEGGNLHNTNNSSTWCLGGGGGSGGKSITNEANNNSGHRYNYQTQDLVAVVGGHASVGKPNGVVGFDFIKEWGAGGIWRQSRSYSDGQYAVTETPAGVGGGGSCMVGLESSARAQDGGLFGGGGGGQSYGGRGGFGGGGGAPFGGEHYGHGGQGVIYVEYISRS